MKKLTIIKRDGRSFIDSREVAEMIGKRHDNLLSDIKKYRDILARGNLLKIKEIDFFVESSYLDTRNRVMPSYLITKLGADLIANKLTGERGVLFTFSYVSRFNEMEAAEHAAVVKAHVRPQLSQINSAIRNVLYAMSEAFVPPDNVMSFLRSIYKPLGIRVAEYGDTTCYYTATDIAKELGINTLSGRPHAHAVSAIISKLNIHESLMTVIPYGLVGVTLRYDYDVIDAVREWLVRNGRPTDIPYLGYFYHIRYKRNGSLYGKDKNGLIIDLDDDDESDPDDFDDDFDSL